MYEKTCKRILYKRNYERFPEIRIMKTKNGTISIIMEKIQHLLRYYNRKNQVDDQKRLNWSS